VHSVLWRNKIDKCSRIIWFAVERIFDSRRIVDIIAMTTFTAYSVHSQRMPISTTPQIEVTVSQSDWHKVGSVDGGSANRRSRNWRSKMPGKTKRSWSTINSEHQVNQRSVNRRSNLIWLKMEKPDLSHKPWHIIYPFHHSFACPLFFIRQHSDINDCSEDNRDDY